MSELRLPVAFFGKAAGLLLVGISLLACVSAAHAADESARIFALLLVPAFALSFIGMNGTMEIRCRPTRSG